MIEAAMYGALGFFTATLLGLAILPAVYRRAVRLTQEAMKAVNPSTYAEVRGAQDHERAQHALALRKVERALEKERENAVTFRLEAGKLAAELIKEKSKREAELKGLRQEFENEDRKKTEGRQAELRAELESIRQKLHETEQALAAAHAEADVLKAKSTDDGGWLPAEDTMALATITGLESQISTLKARLAKYEGGEIPSVDMHLETGAAKLQKIVKDLEAQLVDAETQYISAQAEVARLTVQIETVDLPRDEVVERLERDLKWAETEKARLTALTRDRERTLLRAQNQIMRLRQDLSATPALAGLREELKELGKRITDRDAGPVSKNSENTDKHAVAAASKTAGKTDSRKRPETEAERTAKTRKARKTTSESEDKGQTPVSALVSRIVKSSQANADSNAAPTGTTESEKEPNTGSKDKKRDVA
ncbi:hypothetical protein [uncultured Roseibium sp.]|uniref:hypothetical protein n=1 Tax=uncultured Roseibium sp. TaxID=1936171 RepID=UPI00321730AB